MEVAVKLLGALIVLILVPIKMDKFPATVEVQLAVFVDSLLIICGTV